MLMLAWYDVGVMCVVAGDGMGCYVGHSCRYVAGDVVVVGDSVGVVGCGDGVVADVYICSNGGVGAGVVVDCVDIVVGVGVDYVDGVGDDIAARECWCQWGWCVVVRRSCVWVWCCRWWCWGCVRMLRC